MKNILFLLSFILVVIGGVKSQSVVTFYTTQGNFEVELFDSIVPITAGNFRTLVESKYYDGIIFHRVIKSFMIQGGDPTGTGSGGPGYSIPDEFDSTLSNLKKTISMANLGPNTGGSQFFINMVNNAYLDFDKAPLTSAHPVFGKVISGWDNCINIHGVPVDNTNRPLTDVVMDSIRVTQYPLSVKSLSTERVEVNIYPNPINLESVLEINGSIIGEANIAIYGQNGVLVSNESIQFVNGKNQVSFSRLGADRLPSGIYYVLVSTGSEIIRKRFVVLN